MIKPREGEFIMSKAKNLINEDEKYFAKSGRIKYYPLAIDYGYGATLVDVDGKEYIDLLSSASSQNVGHAPKKVTDAIKKQAENLFIIRQHICIMNHLYVYQRRFVK